MSNTTAQYPEDSQFEDVTLTKVEGHTVLRSDGWSFYVPKDSPVTPVAGMPARFYGKGIGYPVRGLFLDGQKVFYRSEAEDKEEHEIATYGASAEDWLRRWDAGDSCWSIEMGGFGPGYEQALQITMAEILRHMLTQKYAAATWENPEIWEHDREEIETALFANAKIRKLGISGMQWGAARRLAGTFYKEGPRAVMANPNLKDRSIQVCRNFPSID